MTQLKAREPVFNIPGPVLAILALLFAIHFVSAVLSRENWTWLVLAMAFIPARYGGALEDLPGGSLAALTSPVTHILMHADLVHLLVNSAWLLAFGSVLNRRMGTLWFALFSLACGVAGAMAFYLMHPALLAPVIGASGAIAGMMGGVMRFLLKAVDLGIGPALQETPTLVPRMTVKQALSDRRIVLSSIVFVGLNLLTISGFGAFGAAGTVAWEAHIGGYLFGFLAFALFDVAPQNASPTGKNHAFRSK